MFGSRSGGVKQASIDIKNYINSTSDLCNMCFDDVVERDFCAYTCDDLKGLFLKGFGGNYESSISFSYSEGLGFSAEVYISNAKARIVASVFNRIAKDACDSANFLNNLRYSVTPYIPGSSSLSVRFTAIPTSGVDNVTALVVLGGAIGNLAESLV